MPVRVRKSSGNVFADLGFRAEEAENLRLRAELMMRIEKLIETHRLTQSQAADLLGVTQPRISDLIRGRIDRFSIDALVEMLGRAGHEVRFSTRRRRAVA